jgi:hypothetical protein
VHLAASSFRAGCLHSLLFLLVLLLLLLLLWLRDRCDSLIPALCILCCSSINRHTVAAAAFVTSALLHSIFTRSCSLPSSIFRTSQCFVQHMLHAQGPL